MSKNDTRPVILAVDDSEDLLALIGKALPVMQKVREKFSDAPAKAAPQAHR